MIRRERGNYPRFLCANAIALAEQDVINSLRGFVRRITVSRISQASVNPCIGEPLAHQLIGAARWNVVEISDDDQGPLHIFQTGKQLLRFEHSAIFILIIKMRGCEIDDAPVDVHFGANEATPLSLARIQIKTMIGGSDWIAREDRDAVLPSLIFQIESERIIHVREFCELLNLVYAPGALDASIDFLQANEI